MPEQEEEFVPDDDIYDKYFNDQVMLKTGDRRLKYVVVNGAYDLKNVPMRNKSTTKGWKIEVDWKDRTSSWCSLSDIKESCPVQMVAWIGRGACFCMVGVIYQ